MTDASEPGSPLRLDDDATQQRARAAFLGLALGDAWGRPLEFKLVPDVRAMVVDTRAGIFHWTDDTQMAMYLARAILDLPPGPLVEDLLGRAVGRRFAEWAEDPLTPRLAPGSTCLRGARAFARHGDWQRSGDRASDGCGAVMRILPVALAFDGPDLIDAARISAIVTHAHPNAVEASIAGAWLTRQAVLLGRFDEGLVARAIAHLGRDWAWGGSVAESLDAALELADDDGEWLDEDALPPGDGGWRSGSALGLAVAAVLRWGDQGFTTTVDKAARIEGDSDSVAAIAGMLLAGALGPTCLPDDWLPGLPQRDALEELANRCWARGARDMGGATQAGLGTGAAGSPTEIEPDASEGDASKGDASEGDASEGDASEGDASEGDASEGDASEGDDDHDAADGGDARGDAPGSDVRGGGHSAPRQHSAKTQRVAADPQRKTAEAQRVAATAPSLQRSAAGSPGRSTVQLSLTGQPAASPVSVSAPASEPERPRTSIDHPLHVRWLDLSAAGARAPRGRIGLCPAPGRVDGAAWRRHLGVDLDRLVALYQVDHILLLLDPVEQAALGVGALESEAEARGIVVQPLPLGPGAAPTVHQAWAACAALLAVARAGRRIAVVGRDGEERPGTIAAAVLLALGLDADHALRVARAAAGPRAASSQDQRSFLAAFASRSST